MGDWVGRIVAALLATYGVSRLLRRLPLPPREPVRSGVVHAGAALLTCAAVYALRQTAASLPLVLAAQVGWLLLDLARAGASPAPPR